MTARVRPPTGVQGATTSLVPGALCGAGFSPFDKLRAHAQSHLSHLKGSELFETLPCESDASIRAMQVGRIDFGKSAWIQSAERENAWIGQGQIHVS